jgi:hypothetical protein
LCIFGISPILGLNCLYFIRPSAVFPAFSGAADLSGAAVSYSTDLLVLYFTRCYRYVAYVFYLRSFSVTFMSLSGFKKIQHDFYKYERPAKIFTVY